MDFLRLIRFPNLIIVILTQCLLQYCVLLPAIQIEGLSPSLDSLHFALLILSTLLIAAGGYVINDIQDLEIDRINKPEAMIIGRIYSLRSGWLIYWLMNIIGMIISIYLAWYVNNLLLAGIFPVAVFALWLYSAHLKKSLLLGNILVALFCAFVAGIVWFAERESYWLMGADQQEEVRWIFSAYLLFAAISTLYREIIKDIEDCEGDRQQGAKTLAIRCGETAAKKVAGLTGGVLFFLLLFWCFDLFRDQEYLSLTYAIAAILFPLVYSFGRLFLAKSKNDYRQLSQLAKYIMFSGILYLIVYGISI